MVYVFYNIVESRHRGQVDVDLQNWTYQDMLEAIAEREHLNPDDYALVFYGKIPDLNTPLWQLNIINATVVHVVVRRNRNNTARPTSTINYRVLMRGGGTGNVPYGDGIVASLRRKIAEKEGLDEARIELSTSEGVLDDAERVSKDAMLLVVPTE